MIAQILPMGSSNFWPNDSSNSSHLDEFDAYVMGRIITGGKDVLDLAQENESVIFDHPTVAAAERLWHVFMLLVAVFHPLVCRFQLVHILLHWLPWSALFLVIVSARNPSGQSVQVGLDKVQCQELPGEKSCPLRSAPGQKKLSLIKPKVQRYRSDENSLRQRLNDQLQVESSGRSLHAKL